MPRTDYQSALSVEALHALDMLAQNIMEARQARGWTRQEAAGRALLSLNAYRAAEKGNPGTAIGVYLAILDMFALAEHLAEVGAPHRDIVGRQLKQARQRRVP